MTAHISLGSDGDLLIVGVPSYADRVPEMAARSLKRFLGNNTPAIIVCVVLIVILNLFPCFPKEVRRNVHSVMLAQRCAPQMPSTWINLTRPMKRNVSLVGDVSWFVLSMLAILEACCTRLSAGNSRGLMLTPSSLSFSM